MLSLNMFNENENNIILIIINNDTWNESAASELITIIMRMTIMKVRQT